MIEIDLNGFLLTPIQRICKYPLQLKELKKTFDESEDMFQFVNKTYELMQLGCALGYSFDCRSTLSAVKCIYKL